MKNELGTEVEYIEINFILMGTISQLLGLIAICFQKSEYVKITKPITTVQ